MLITSDGSYRSYNVDFQNKSSTFFISIMESRKQEVYLSDKPINTGTVLEGGELIFYQNGEPVNSIKVASILEPLDLEHGYYDISLISKGDTIFTVQRFPINDNSGKFINFFASGSQVNVKGVLRVDNMSLGGAKVTFTDVDNNSYSMNSNFSGEFNGYLPARKYRLKVEIFGYQLKKEVNLLYDFTSNITSYELNLELKEIPSIVRGRVFDDQSIPLNDALVTIKTEGKAFETYTDNYGRFAGETNAGLVFIKVEKEGFFHHGVVQKVEKSSTLSNLEIKITRKLFSLRGIISDGVSPIKRKRLDLIDENGRRFASTLSGDNGYYEFLDIPATKTFHIKSNIFGYKYFSSEPFVLKETNEAYNIILNPLGNKVVLQILNNDNTPLKEASVTINEMKFVTDINGMIYAEPSNLPVVVSVKGSYLTLDVIEGQYIYQLIF